MIKRVMSRFPVSFFCFAVPKHSVGKPFVLCFRKLPVVKKLRIREGGVSRYSVEIFLSDSVKNFLGRTILCFRIFGYRINFAREGYVSIFGRHFFRLAVPESFVGQPFCAVFQKTLGNETFSG